MKTTAQLRHETSKVASPAKGKTTGNPLQLAAGPEEEALQRKQNPLQLQGPEEELQMKQNPLQLQGPEEELQMKRNPVQLQGPEEEPMQMKQNPLQLQGPEEELQMKRNPVQLQGPEEEPMQKKKNPLQLQAPEEELQMKRNPVQLQGPEEELQMKRTPIQLKGPEEEPMQMKQHQMVPVQKKKENKTGLPDQLKSGVENLSGYSMDNVKVHYNSSQPAQLNALAYAQGTDIHVGPGQEKHLPHEAWHVVQQMQGRVQPTMQMKEGVAVNDDKGLENEADAMGEKAAAIGDQNTLTQLKDAGLGDKNNGVRQAKFAGTGAKLLQLLITGAPAIYTLLVEKLAEIESEITINFETGGSAMNFNFSDHSINLNGILVGQAIDARNAKEAGWQETMAFVYSAASHELRHAYDFFITKLPFVTGVIESVPQIYGLYQTELNAWQSEARALIESGLPGEPLVQAWLTVDPTTENPDNMIWARIKHYTNNNFAGRLPPGWTWEAKMKTKMMEKLAPWILDLKTKLKARYEQAFPVTAPVSGGAGVSGVGVPVGSGGKPEEKKTPVPAE